MDGYPDCRIVGVVSGGIVGKRVPLSTATNQRKPYRGAHLLLPVSPIPSSCPSLEQRDLHFCLEKFYALFIAKACQRSWMFPVPPFYNLSATRLPNCKSSQEFGSQLQEVGPVIILHYLSNFARSFPGGTGSHLNAELRRFHTEQRHINH